MQGSSSTDPNPSSGPIVSGTLSLIDYFEAVARDYQDSVKQALEDIAVEERDTLQKQASDSDTGWSQFADKIHVGYNFEEQLMEYSVPVSGSDLVKAQALEYGDETAAPQPLLRKHAIRSNADLSKRVMARTHAILFGRQK